MEINEAASQKVRKLSVVDTLDHARLALSTHRQWLKRRVSNDFGVIIEDEKNIADCKVNQWTVADIEDEETAQKEHKTSSLQPDSYPRAPPTFLPAQRVRKTAGLFLKVGGSRVSPAPVLESLEELVEERNVEPSAVASQAVTWATGEGGSTVENGDDANSGKEGSPQEIPKSKRPKMKLVSRAAVSPATTKSPPDTQNDINSSVPLHLFVSSRTPSAPDAPAHSSPPDSPTTPDGGTLPHGSTLSAWGSLTSLDNYMESLKAVTHDQKPSEIATTDSSVHQYIDTSTSIQLQGSSSGETCTSEHENVKDSMEDSYPAASNTHPASNTHSAEAVSNHEFFCGSHSPTCEDLPPNQAMEPPHKLTIDVGALQSRSGATILPVVPAPKDRQSSYEAHHLSRLEQVGKGLRVVEIKGRALSQEESGSQVRITSGRKTSNVGRNITTPEPLVEDVLPYQTEENEAVVQSEDVRSQLLQPDLSCHNVQEPTASSTQTPTVETHETTKTDSALDPTGPESHTQGGGGGEGGGGGGGVVRDGGEEISFHPRLTSTPSVPLEGDAKREEDTVKRRRQILEELQLPPLRDNSSASSELHSNVY